MDAARTRVLYLVPSWEHVGVVRRVGMLASHFEPGLYEFHVAVLSARGPDPSTISETSFRSTSLAAGPRLGMTLAWRLRQVVNGWGANIVQVWNRGNARVARAALMGLRSVRLVETRICELPPAIDAEAIRREADAGPIRNQLIRELGLPEGSRLLGFAGRLTRDTQLKELLWALDQIRCVRDDVYLLVIGDGEARPLFERFARLYEIADGVRFVGWRGDSAGWLAALDVYCTASTRQSPSLALLEALALGRPVVASDTPAHRRIVSPGETGFLADIRQRSELARWCLRVLDDADLAAGMSEAGRRQTAARFPIGPLLEMHRQLYRV
jgi:glycosyltransferase involved in cell wall biosynthesis